MRIPEADKSVGKNTVDGRAGPEWPPTVGGVDAYLRRLPYCSSKHT